MELYLIQVFSDDVWRTVCVSSFIEDAQEDFDVLREEIYPLETWRLVRVAYSSLDFLTHDARDFRILELAKP